jgi:hypothetical protein
MSFLYPVFLSALLLLIIPILVHLFRFRKHRVVRFTRVRLLREVEIETKNQNRLKHLITLICRMLALACLVLAFAIPTCQQGDQVTGKSRVSIFIDNSFSMDNSRDGQILLETAKQSAREIVRSFDKNGEFQIRSLLNKGTQMRFVSASEAISYIDAIKIQSGTITLSKLLKNMADDLKQSGKSHSAFVISDFQKDFTGEPQVLSEVKGLSVTFVKIAAAKRANISIDSAWLEKPYAVPGEKNTLRFRISNYTQEPLEDFPVKLYAESGLIGTGRIAVKPENRAESSIDFLMENKTSNPGRLIIEEPGAAFDNVLYINLSSCSNRNIGLSESNRFVEGVINAQPFLRKTSGLNPFSGQKSGSDDVFMWVGPGNLSKSQAELLKDWLSATGATAIVAADIKSKSESMQQVFGLPEAKPVNITMRVSDKGFSHPFFTGVFEQIPQNMNVPEIKNYLSTQGSSGSGEAILNLENGDPLIIRLRVGRGLLYFFTASLNEDGGNLVKSPLFLPLLTQAIIAGNSRPPLYGICNSGKILPLNYKKIMAEKPPVLKNNEWEGIAEITSSGDAAGIFLGAQPEKAGNYSLLENGTENLLAYISVNDSRLESNPNMASDKVMKEWTVSNDINWLQGNNAIAAFQNKIADTTKWRLFIWFAAVFFALEVLVLVFWDSWYNKTIKRQLT